MQSLFFVLIFVSASYGGVLHSGKEKILNGEAIPIEKVPYQAFIRTNGSSYTYCGAAIISDVYILTAAHCLEEQPNPAIWRVGVGKTLRSDMKLLTVVDLGVNSQHNVPNNFDNDIAFLKLERPLQFSESIQPIKISDELPPLGTNTYISGWGRIELRDDQLYGLDMYVDNCSRPSASQFCTNNDSSEPTHAWKGDSGSPIAWDGKLVGIHSYGNSGNNRNGHADVVYLRNWIKQNTGV